MSFWRDGPGPSVGCAHANVVLADNFVGPVTPNRGVPILVTTVTLCSFLKYPLGPELGRVRVDRFLSPGRHIAPLHQDDLQRIDSGQALCGRGKSGEIQSEKTHGNGAG